MCQLNWVWKCLQCWFFSTGGRYDAILPSATCSYLVFILYLDVFFSWCRSVNQAFRVNILCRRFLCQCVLSLIIRTLLLVALCCIRSQGLDSLSSSTATLFLLLFMILTLPSEHFLFQSSWKLWVHSESLSASMEIQQNIIFHSRTNCGCKMWKMIFNLTTNISTFLWKTFSKQLLLLLNTRKRTTPIHSVSCLVLSSSHLLEPRGAHGYNLPPPSLQDIQEASWADAHTLALGLNLIQPLCTKWSLVDYFPPAVFSAMPESQSPWKCSLTSSTGTDSFICNS